MGCLKSKSAERRSSRYSRSSIAYSVPEFATTVPDKLSDQEMDDVITVMNTLRVEQLDLVAVSCMFDRLFMAYPEIRQIFVKAAFLDPDHAMGCTSDPWFQGFLKAYFNALIKYVVLQNDEPGLKEFLVDLKENHERIKGIEKRHVQLMMQCLYVECAYCLGSSIDSRKRSALEHLISLLYQDALEFLPVLDNTTHSVTDDASSSKPGQSVTSDKNNDTRTGAR